MNIFQKDIRTDLSPRTCFDRNFISERICDTGKVFLIKHNFSVQRKRHLMICCPVDANLYFLIFRRRRFSRLLIIVAVAAFVFLPEPAAIVISYVHTVLIRLISEVNAHSVTVVYSCICII